MQALDRIVPLTQKNRILFTEILPPDPLIKIGAQRFIQKMILCLRIPLSGILFIPFCPPRNVTGSLHGLDLINAPLHILLLLPPQIVLLYHVPKGASPPHIVRQIRPEMPRIDAAESLDADQSPFLSVKSFHCRQRMRIFRSETMYHIRPEFLHDLFQPSLRSFLVHFRPVNILIKSKGMYPAVRSRCLQYLLKSRQAFFRRKAHAEFCFIFFLMSQNSSAQSGKPSLLIAGLQSEMLRHDRQHNIANPQYPHHCLSAFLFPFPAISQSAPAADKTLISSVIRHSFLSLTLSVTFP